MEGNKVRWRIDTGVELRCRTCADWWPLTDEFWSMHRGFRRCKACYLEGRRNELRRVPYVPSPAVRARRLVRDNARKAAERRDPERRPALLARQRETQRAYYERRRIDVLTRRRAAYVERVGHEPATGIGRPRLVAA